MMIDACQPQIFIRLSAEFCHQAIFGGHRVDNAAGHLVEQFLQVFV